MPVTVKNISLWRKEVENQVGTLAHTLEPVTKAGANLHVLMGYRYPGEGTRAAIEFYPIAGKKVTAAASEGDQYDFLCCSGGWSKILGRARVRVRSRRQDSETAHQEGDGEQEEVKGDKRRLLAQMWSGSFKTNVFIGLQRSNS